jgi:hypothetical protein
MAGGCPPQPRPTYWTPQYPARRERAKADATWPVSRRCGWCSRNPPATPSRPTLGSHRPFRGPELDWWLLKVGLGVHAAGAGRVVRGAASPGGWRRQWPRGPAGEASVRRPRPCAPCRRGCVQWDDGRLRIANTALYNALRVVGKDITNLRVGANVPQTVTSPGVLAVGGCSPDRAGGASKDGRSGAGVTAAATSGLCRRLWSEVRRCGRSDDGVG